MTKTIKYFLCGIMYIITIIGVLFLLDITYLRTIGVVGMTAVFYNALKEIEDK